MATLFNMLMAHHDMQALARSAMFAWNLLDRNGQSLSHVREVYSMSPGFHNPNPIARALLRRLFILETQCSLS